MEDFKVWMTENHHDITTTVGFLVTSPMETPMILIVVSTIETCKTSRIKIHLSTETGNVVVDPRTQTRMALIEMSTTGAHRVLGIEIDKSSKTGSVQAAHLMMTHMPFTQIMTVSTISTMKNDSTTQDEDLVVAGTLQLICQVVCLTTFALQEAHKISLSQIQTVTQSRLGVEAARSLEDLLVHPIRLEALAASNRNLVVRPVVVARMVLRVDQTHLRGTVTGTGADPLEITAIPRATNSEEVICGQVLPGIDATLRT
mmetsp:Transcript_86449/g.249696  ORF Transcript_86449/g.249696 Transcript_86449/m.249696 type:complete len:258 (+) Transcript_86449:227-1000(+)